MGQEYISQVNAVLSQRNDYEVTTGTAADAYATLIENAEPYLVSSILIEEYDAIASLKDAAGVWGDDIILPKGLHDIEVECYGVKLKNRTAGQNSEYQVFGQQNV